jgi:elongator complex protein 3
MDGAHLTLLNVQYDSDRQRQACHEIARRLLLDLRGAESPEELKLIVARSYQLPSIPRNSDILAVVSGEERAKLREKLQLKRVRSISGVHVIGVMSAPHQCPHGRCAYCPQEKDAPRDISAALHEAMSGCPEWVREPFS